MTQDGWDCGYVPLALDVQPFVIGRDSENENDGRVFIDLDSPLIAGDDEENGIAIFDEMGAESEYLKIQLKIWKCCILALKAEKAMLIGWSNMIC